MLIPRLKTLFSETHEMPGGLAQAAAIKDRLIACAPGLSLETLLIRIGEVFQQLILTRQAEEAPDATDNQDGSELEEITIRPLVNYDYARFDLADPGPSSEGSGNTSRVDLTRWFNLSSRPHLQTVSPEEHYCRRWRALEFLVGDEHDGADPMPRGAEAEGEIRAGMNKAIYKPDEESEEKLLVLAAAYRLPFRDVNRAVSIAISIPPQYESLFPILSELPDRPPEGSTCERCRIIDCDLRQGNRVPMRTEEYLEQPQVTQSGRGVGILYYHHFWEGRRKQRLEKFIGPDS